MSSRFWGVDKVFLDPFLSNGISLGKWMALTFFIENLMGPSFQHNKPERRTRRPPAASTLLNTGLGARNGTLTVVYHSCAKISDKALVAGPRSAWKPYQPDARKRKPCPTK